MSKNTQNTENTENAEINANAHVAMIDALTLKSHALKGLGLTLGQRKDRLTVAYQYTVADMVHKPIELADFLQIWMNESILSDEARRTAKTALCNAVVAWGDGMITCEMNERTKGTKVAGVHIRYLTDLEKVNADYIADVKSLVALIEKKSHALYDALATIEMNAQERTHKGLTDKEFKALVKKVATAQNKGKLANEASQIADEQANILASLVA